MRWLVLWLLLGASALAVQVKLGNGVKISTAGIIASGCGPGTDQLQCGQYLATSSFSTAGQTAVSTVLAAGACDAAGASLIAGNWYLDIDLGNPAATNVQCVKFVTGMTLNLNGHTINGAVCRNGNITSGEMYNGTITSDAATGLASCTFAAFDIESPTTCPTSTIKIHDLTIVNSGTTGSNNGRSLRITSGTLPSNCTITPFYEIYNVSVNPPQQTNTSRTYALDLQGQASQTYDWVHVHNILCSVLNADAAQCIALANMSGGIVENNKTVGNTNAWTHDNPRLISIDGGNPNTSGSSGFCGDPSSSSFSCGGSLEGHTGSADHDIIVRNNSCIDVGNARCIRLRAAYNITVSNNQATGVQVINGYAGHCFHLADQDSYNLDLSTTVITNNSCEIGPSVDGGFITRGFASAFSISGNTFTCLSGGCGGAHAWHVNVPSGNGYRSELTISNETTAALPSPQVIADYGRASGSSAPIAKAITNVSRSGGIATYTATGHGMTCVPSTSVSCGQKLVAITGLSDTTFNSVKAFVTTLPDGNTLTVQTGGSDVSSTAMAGTVTAIADYAPIINYCNVGTVAANGTPTAIAPTLTNTCP